MPRWSGHFSWMPAVMLPLRDIYSSIEKLLILSNCYIAGRFCTADFFGKSALGRMRKEAWLR
jgi:hypothetical protein